MLYCIFGIGFPNIYKITVKSTLFVHEKCLIDGLRAVSLFRGGGGGSYQYFKQGSQKILTLPLNTNKKNCDPPPAIAKKL